MTARKDLTILFVGALVQWTATAAFTRVLTSRMVTSLVLQLLLVFVSAFASQSIWFWNITQVTSNARTKPRWLAWCSGMALGSVVGYLLT